MKTTFVVALVLALAVAASARVLNVRSRPPAGWATRDAANPETPVTFFVAMKQENLDVLEEAFWAVSTPGNPQYRQFKSRGEIMDIVKPTTEVRSRVLAWLSQYVTLDAVEDLGDAYKVNTVASVAELALNTRFVNYHHHRTGRNLVRQYGPYSVPASLDDAVVMVAGVAEFPDMDRVPKRAAAAFDGIVPQTLTAAYNAAGAKATGNTSVAVIEWENQNYSPSDLASFAKQTNTDIPALNPSHVVGANQPQQPGDEAQLDIEWALATGLGAEGWFWLNGNSAWLYGWATDFFGTADVPLVVSMSYGWNEEDQCQQGIGGTECQQLGVDSATYVARVNVEFQKIGLRGVSLFASSGDSGANGRTDGYCSEKHLNPTFPAASPYVTAVGATQIVSPQTNLQNPPSVCSSGSVTCVSGGQETAVSYAQAHFASGGGFSNQAARPSYQTAAVDAYLKSGVALPPAGYYNTTSRGYPDVAAFGSAIVIIFNGGVQGVGGTSCSSPIFAGYASLLNDAAIQQDGKPLGFLNPLLYKAAAEQPSVFNDVTVGDNKCTENGCGLFGSCKGFEAAKGWDPVTGLGSPNFANLLSYVKTQL